MGNLPNLTPAEFEIMEVLWEKGELSTKEVVAAISNERKPAYNTVATVLTRLRQKGCVAAREQNFAYVYQPLIDREEVQTSKLDDLVDRFLNGNLSPLAVYIAKRRKLKPEQIAALAEILESQSTEEE